MARFILAYVEQILVLFTGSYFDKRNHRNVYTRSHQFLIKVANWNLDRAASGHSMEKTSFTHRIRVITEIQFTVAKR